jgi:tetratricopeptide (TPR) repeat protein
MRRWFLSYNSQDFKLAESLESGLLRRDGKAHIYFAPKSLRAGGLWLPELAREITEATAFVLLVGENGIGPWQAMEYYEALDRRAKQHDFPVVLVLLDGQPAPGLPFLRQLHWVITADPASEKTLAQVMDGVAGAGSPPRELWRHTAPYRGLLAMTESDADFFFGRACETVEVINALAAAPNRVPVLLGNSGVGKSSLAQAGVLAALMRQAWPEAAEAPGTWPAAFAASRRWCFLKLKPGPEPVRALVEPFLWTWQIGAVDPERAELLASWVARLSNGKVTLRDLLDATQARYRDELHQPEPPAFLISIDQGEELYVRASERERRRFSELLVQGLGDSRLRAMMSMRADFFGDLQKDEPLYSVHRLVNVPPLRESHLREVVGRPAILLDAQFESGNLANSIAHRTAEESTRDAGALPLLSYLLDDMWTKMVHRGDGVLRLPAQAIELGRVLADRANALLVAHPTYEDAIRRILTLKLATVREDGEPTRRRAPRAEFTDQEWLLVTELANQPNRLVVTAKSESGETFAEVAHEAIFRRWEKLSEWIAAEREFLVWRGGVEADRRRWEGAREDSRDDALLTGLALAQAQSWLAKRSEGVDPATRKFVEQSTKVEADRREKARNLEIQKIKAQQEMEQQRIEIDRLQQLEQAVIARDKARRKLKRVSVISAVTVLTLALLAGGSAYYALIQLKKNETFLNDTISRAELIVREAERQGERFGVPLSVRIELLTQAEDMFGVIARYGAPTPEMRAIQTRSLIASAKTSRVLGNTAKQRERATEARNIAATLVAANPANRDWQSLLAAANLQIGDASVAQGNVGEALAAYRNAISINTGLVNIDLSRWQRDLAVSYWRIGDVLKVQGNLLDAFNAYRDSLVIIERLASADPANAGWQRDLAVSYGNIGDALDAQGKLEEALRAYRDSLAIIERVAKADPENADWQHDLAASYRRIGNALEVQGKLDEALQAYRDGLVIAERVAGAFPRHADWQRDLALSYGRVGIVEARQGARDVALQQFQEGRNIIVRLRALAPEIAVLPNDLAWFDSQIASLER